ncbi:hypothetical protein HDK77DRAFT_98179 [Phyllosticta capitalensis]
MKVKTQTCCGVGSARPCQLLGCFWASLLRSTLAVYHHTSCSNTNAPSTASGLSAQWTSEQRVREKPGRTCADAVQCRARATGWEPCIDSLSLQWTTAPDGHAYINPSIHPSIHRKAVGRLEPAFRGRQGTACGLLSLEGTSTTNID